MEPRVDLRVAELLCSRLCHDLVGPIGAVNNGLELLEESGVTREREAFGLTKMSAALAARRLRFLRIAFGHAVGVEVTHRAVREIAEGWFEGGRVRLSWPESGTDPEAILPGDRLRLLFNLLLLAGEALPREGVVRVETAPGEVADAITVAASGENARFREGVREALTGRVRVNDLDARLVQAYFTNRLAKRLRTEIVPTAGEGGWVRLATRP